MRAGVAVSREHDVRDAARDAAARALQNAGLAKAGCLVVAGTPDHLDQALDLCDELRRVAGSRTHIVGGATSAAMVPRSTDEEGPPLGVLPPEQPGPLLSLSDDSSELRAAALRAGPGALGLVFADPGAPLQRVAAALSREAPQARIGGGGVAVDGGLLLDDDVVDAHAVGVFFAAPARVTVAQ